jgi:hypothetical protein
LGVSFTQRNKQGYAFNVEQVRWKLTWRNIARVFLYMGVSGCRIISSRSLIGTQCNDEISASAKKTIAKSLARQDETRTGLNTGVVSVFKIYNELFGIDFKLG